MAKQEAEPQPSAALIAALVVVIDHLPIYVPKRADSNEARSGP
jgi:hypothetical protein